MRVLALYLPQFHAFAENDEWWGKGYTEWTAVKRAKPLYPGHLEPRIPKGGDYYDLSDENAEALKRQAREARDYGIYGFCFYHYYFTGKTLMEKPLSILLAHPEISLNYCLCWANESWTRTWYGLEEEVLMRQEYGSVGEWEEHFRHLLPFFRDPRYIRIGNRPMLHVYRPPDIRDRKEMFSYFDRRAREEGFDGIFTVGGRTAAFGRKEDLGTDAAYYFEPGFTLRHDMGALPTFLDQARTALIRSCNRMTGSEILERRIPIERIYGSIARREYAENEFPGIFPRWDNTPRRSYRGLVYTGASPEKFGGLLRILRDKVRGRENDFVYVNAYNEWGEGAMLEADEAEGDAYLMQVRRVMEEG